MTGNQADVYCRPMLHFKHNYNYVTRATMYQWMNRHLNLGLDDPVVEQDYRSLTDEEMAVWNDDHPAPKETGIAHQRNVCRWFDRQAEQKIAGAKITNQESLKKYHEQVGEAWNVIFDRELPPDVTYSKEKTVSVNDWTVERGMVSVDARNTHLPTLTIRNAKANNKRVYVWSLDGGKSTVLNEDGEPIDLAMKLISDGSTLIVADLYHQGSNMVQDVSPDEQPLIKDKRPYSAFTFGYNRTAVVQRSADLMAIVAHAASSKPDSIRLIGSGSAALWVVPAAAKLGKSIDDVVITDGDVRFANAKDYSDVTFVPGSAKYGDLPALLALRAPYRVTVLADKPAPNIVTQAYQGGGDSSALRWEIGKNGIDSIIAWSKKQ